MKQIGAIVEGVEAAANRTITAESRLNDKLKMLRDNIKQARAQAEKVSYFCSTEEKHSWQLIFYNPDSSWKEYIFNGSR